MLYVIAFLVIQTGFNLVKSAPFQNLDPYDDDNRFYEELVNHELDKLFDEATRNDELPNEEDLWNPLAPVEDLNTPETVQEENTPDFDLVQDGQEIFPDGGQDFEEEVELLKMAEDLLVQEEKKLYSYLRTIGQGSDFQGETNIDVEHYADIFGKTYENNAPLDWNELLQKYTSLSEPQIFSKDKSLQSTSLTPEKDFSKTLDSNFGRSAPQKQTVDAGRYAAGFGENYNLDELEDWYEQLKHFTHPDESQKYGKSVNQQIPSNVNVNEINSGNKHTTHQKSNVDRNYESEIDEINNTYDQFRKYNNKINYLPQQFSSDGLSQGDLTSELMKEYVNQNNLEAENIEAEQQNNNKYILESPQEIEKKINEVTENRFDETNLNIETDKIDQNLNDLDINDDGNIQVITLDQEFQPSYFGRKLNEYRYEQPKSVDSSEMQQDAPVPVEEHVEMKKITNVERSQRPSNERYALIDGFLSELDKDIGHKQSFPPGFAVPSSNSNVYLIPQTTTERSFWRKIGDSLGLTKKNK